MQFVIQEHVLRMATSNLNINDNVMLVTTIGKNGAKDGRPETCWVAMVHVGLRELLVGFNIATDVRE